MIVSGWNAGFGVIREDVTEKKVLMAEFKSQSAKCPSVAHVMRSIEESESRKLAWVRQLVMYVPFANSVKRASSPDDE